MIHYSCDRCKCELGPDDVRYVVHVEAYATMDLLGGEQAEEDRDYLLEIHEILERRADAESELIGDDVYQKLSFDLCPQCYKAYLKAPVGREPAAQLDFSQN